MLGQLNCRAEAGPFESTGEGLLGRLSANHARSLDLQKVDVNSSPSVIAAPRRRSPELEFEWGNDIENMSNVDRGEGHSPQNSAEPTRRPASHHFCSAQLLTCNDRNN